MKTIHPSKSFIKNSRPNSIYVDKTESIYNPLRVSDHDRAFVSRPRRFGKSLTLDTIGTLCEYGVVPLFEGTWLCDHRDRNEDTDPIFAPSLLQPTPEFKIATTGTIYHTAVGARDLPWCTMYRLRCAPS